MSFSFLLKLSAVLLIGWAIYCFSVILEYKSTVKDLSNLAKVQLEKVKNAYDYKEVYNLYDSYKDQKRNSKNYIELEDALVELSISSKFNFNGHHKLIDRLRAPKFDRKFKNMFIVRNWLSRLTISKKTCHKPWFVYPLEIDGRFILVQPMYLPRKPFAKWEILHNQSKKSIKGSCSIVRLSQEEIMEKDSFAVMWTDALTGTKYMETICQGKTKAYETIK